MCSIRLCLLIFFPSWDCDDMLICNLPLQSVLDGYNGTVMAYGQTGTGKTYTLGRLGEEDTAARGIMVRAMEDILADVSLETNSVSISYLQVVGSTMIIFVCMIL